MREGNFELKDDPAGVAAGGGVLRASLTSNSPRAPLRQANNDPIRTLSGSEPRRSAARLLFETVCPRPPAPRGGFAPSFPAEFPNYRDTCMYCPPKVRHIRIE